VGLRGKARSDFRFSLTLMYTGVTRSRETATVGARIRVLSRQPAMDYHLENVRTGETYSLNPNRTLIGLAEHADIRTADAGTYLAALIVRYSSGWTIHGLADNPAVKFNGQVFRAGMQIAPRYGDRIDIGEEEFRFRSPRGPAPSALHDGAHSPNCYLYVRDQDGQEECRTVDHDVLFGRLSLCHVRFPDTRLSRVAALLAAHEGRWFIHALSKGPIGRNRRAVTGFAPVEDGDELLIGPLVVRIELRPHSDPGEKPAPNYESSSEDLDDVKADTAVGDSGHTVETELPVEPEPVYDCEALKAAGLRLDNWLKGQTPPPPPSGNGLSGWLGAQKLKLNRFWFDTPEATTARGLRAAEKYDEAFALLDRAIRAHPNSPELLRELYRLYDALGLYDLCYRPLRVIEKLATIRGSVDTWVLETLARICERLSTTRQGMFERAISYWSKLEKVTGVSYARERDAARATRALREGGFTRAVEDS